MPVIGLPELLIIVVGWVIPIVVLTKVASRRAQSRMYGFWGLLGYLGLIIGLLIMIAVGRGSRPADSN